MRDSQRQKVYNAERVVLDFQHHPNRYSKSLGIKEMSIEECQALVDKALRSKVIQRKHRRATYRVLSGPEMGTMRPRPIKVYRTHGGGRGGGLTIFLGVWARQPMVVLHELAHCLTYGDVDQAHGWEFCACYLDLVRTMLGVERHDALKTSFKKHGVKFTAPRAKRQISPERREMLVGQLAAARAAKTAAKEQS